MSGLPRITRLAFAWGFIVCGTAASTAGAQEVQQRPESSSAVIPRTPFARPQSFDPQSFTTTQRPGPFISERFQRVQTPRSLFGLPAPENRYGLNDQHVIVVSTLVLVLGAVIVVLLIT